MDRLRVRPDAAAAPGRVLRDGAAPVGRTRAPGCSSTSRRARSWCSRAVTPARCAATACRRSNRSCFPSTTRPAPVRAATGWACRSSSIRSASSCIRTCRSPAARCAAGTGATTHYFQLIQSLATPLRLRHRDALEGAAARTCSTCCCTAAARKSIEFSYREAAGHARRASAIPSRASCPTSSGAIARPQSPIVREELAQYLGMRPCPECEGTRLNRAARFVFVAGAQPAADRASDGRPRARVLPRLELAGWRGEVAAQDRQGRARSAALPRRRGTRLPDARSQRRDALGRRSAAHPPRQPGRLGPHRRHVHPR